MKIIILIFLLAFVNLYCEYWNQFQLKYSKLTETQKLDLNNKRIENKRKVEEFNKSKGTDWKISWHSNTKYMRSATSRIEKINSTDSLFIVMFAEEMLSDFLPFIGVNREELIISRVIIDTQRETYQVLYHQHVNGIQFEQYGKISVIYNSKGMLEIGNNCFANFRMNTIPSITTNEAWEIVKSDALSENRLYLEQFYNPETEKEIKEIVEIDGTYHEKAGKPFGTIEELKEKANLLIYQTYERTNEGKLVYKDFKLAYKIIIPLENYYIDAMNGEVIHKVSNVKGLPYNQE